MQPATLFTSTILLLSTFFASAMACNPGETVCHPGPENDKIMVCTSVGALVESAECKPGCCAINNELGVPRALCVC